MHLAQADQHDMTRFIKFMFVNDMATHIKLAQTDLENVEESMITPAGPAET